MHSAGVLRSCWPKRWIMSAFPFRPVRPLRLLAGRGMIVVGGDPRRDIVPRHTTTDQPGNSERHPVEFLPCVDWPVIVGRDAGCAVWRVVPVSHWLRPFHQRKGKPRRHKQLTARPHATHRKTVRPERRNTCSDVNVISGRVIPESASKNEECQRKARISAVSGKNRLTPTETTALYKTTSTPCADRIKSGPSRQWCRMPLSCHPHSSPSRPLFSGFHLPARRSICLPTHPLFAVTTRRDATRAEGVGCAAAAFHPSF